MAGWYLTLGRYDGVLIAEAPSAEVATGLLLATGMQGFVTAETMRAFTEEEFKGIVGNLP